MARTKKDKKKPREPRNLEAVNAQFRKAGSMKDKRKKREDDHGKQQRTLEEEYQEE